LNVSALLVIRQLGKSAYCAFVLVAISDVAFITVHRIVTDGMPYDIKQKFCISGSGCQSAWSRIFDFEDYCLLGSDAV